MAGLPALSAVLIMVGTILLIARRPRGLGEGIAAAIGAGLMLLAGWATPADVWRTAQATGGAFLRTRR